MYVEKFVRTAKGIVSDFTVYSILMTKLFMHYFSLDFTRII